MNILFLTLLSFESFQERSIYTDLLREFIINGHRVFAISPTEKREKNDTHLIIEDNSSILRLQIGNTQKTNIFEKGISTVMIEPTFKKAIKKFFSDVKFDLVLYSTPPITLVSAIEYVKRRDGAKTYLLLKDIFPQNAVDIGILNKQGVKGPLYKHFRKMEKRLYKVSDYIGCMSQANVDYIINNNPDVASKKIEVCPNSIEIVDKSVTEKERERIRIKYRIPLNKKVFIYGGNLGRPQGIPFIIECLKVCENVENAYFLIVGDGTEYYLLDEYVKNTKQKNVKLMKRLPKQDYDTMVGACDVGMIFLDYRFTIPNFPSRLLSYMQAKLPVLACTDTNTDIGKTIVEGGFGWWCESRNVNDVKKLIYEIINSDLDGMKKREWDYLNDNFSVADSYSIIENSIR